MRKPSRPNSARLNTAVTRKQFLQATLGLASVSLIAACGDPEEEDDDGSGETEGEVCSENLTVSIDTNHGHTIDIPPEDVDAAETKTYTLMSGSHTHEVTVEGLQFEQLKELGSFSVTSTGDGGHSHRVNLSC